MGPWQVGAFVLWGVFTFIFKMRDRLTRRQDGPRGSGDWAKPWRVNIPLGLALSVVLVCGALLDGEGSSLWIPSILIGLFAGLGMAWEESQAR